MNHHQRPSWRAAFETAVILALVTLLWRGPEQHGKHFLQEEAA